MKKGGIKDSHRSGVEGKGMGGIGNTNEETHCGMGVVRRREPYVYVKYVAETDSGSQEAYVCK